jgi:asparagine synthase (glutamine-hydrolysing)
MCGITGLLSSGAAPPDGDLLRRMTGALRHRGPDDEGFFTDRELALGFRRLSIIDLEGGRQPMTSDCGRYTIVFNGEIYNHADVRHRLERDHGVGFRTRSDTEVILNAFRQWGATSLDQLNGMFAFAIWDALQRKLFLARDRLGKKPLYFARTSGGFCFASEVKVLLLHPELGAQVDQTRIATFLTYRYVPGDETLFKGIDCLPPASFLEVSAVGAEPGPPQTYWDYEFAADPGPSRDGVGGTDALVAELRELLADSVRLRMIADVPVGAFLSGGLDSSLIVALMSGLHPDPVKTFSIGFDTGVTETAYARQVAARYRTDHHDIQVGWRDLLDHIPAVLHARETPITEASDIPLFLLARRAVQEVKVVLSGEGGDEILAGYPKYAFEHRLGRTLGFVPRAALTAIAPALPFRARRLQLALECAAQADRLERHACWFGAFSSPLREELLSAALPQQDLHAFSEGALRGKAFPSPVEEMMYLDTRHWLPANLLLRGDRMTMAHSLELRCPLLDYRLVEFAARRIPRRLKIRGGSGKWILKRLAEGLLPPDVLKRAKWGFKVPLAEWFRGALAPVLKDVLLSPRCLSRGYYRPDRLRGLLEAHVAGRANYEKRLWILLQLELWHLMFVDRSLSPSQSLTDLSAPRSLSASLSSNGPH